jgi:hypothetical protein
MRSTMKDSNHSLFPCLADERRAHFRSFLHAPTRHRFDGLGHVGMYMMDGLLDEIQATGSSGPYEEFWMQAFSTHAVYLAKVTGLSELHHRDVSV